MAIGFYTHARLSDGSIFASIMAVEYKKEMTVKALESEATVVGSQDYVARQTPPMDLRFARAILGSRAHYSFDLTAVCHTSQLPSNLPCEDTWSSHAFTPFNDAAKDWGHWAIFDGHAGLRTSQVLKECLAASVGEQLWKAGCMDRPYTPNDSQIVDVIKKAFVALDDKFCGKGLHGVQSGEGNLANIIATAAFSFSGSCALLAFYDPARIVLRVANTGDSRAVLGRWNEETKTYVAQPMSVDQTGFNQQEVARLAREHPGEDVVDSSTGRLFGLAVTRAFGDARWKWANDITKRAHDLYWGPQPRPDGLVKTPPYLTAEPEVMETLVQTGEKPDFLIMASDGLWGAYHVC